MNLNARRQFFAGAAASVAGLAVARSALAGLPEPVIQTSVETAPPTDSDHRRPYNPVVTLNGWTLPWRMNNGVKEFHLVAEPVVREVAPGFKVNMWGYNGQSPGPTIEVVEGDRVRIFRDQQAARAHHHPLARPAPAQRHGRCGRAEPAAIPVGKTFVYEFEARRPGTFMYHPHADEMVQMAMGMMGMWVTHPKAKHPTSARWTGTSAFCSTPLTWSLAARHPKSTPCWTSTSGAGTAGCSRPSTPERAPERPVRIRVGNLTMTNHPIHLHGHEFLVTGTDGGPTPKSTRWYEVTTDVAVGQMRQIELIADEEGDWAMHCHKSHHTMNAMGHDVPTMIGVDHRGLVKPRSRRWRPTTC
jgi:FtsP/CotA-like multicopper oxidase with cupredoxin domain